VIRPPAAHAQGYAVWAAIRGDAACTVLLEMNGAGITHEGLYVTSQMQAIGAWRKNPDAFADTLKIATIFSKYTVKKYGGHYYGKAQDIRRCLRAQLMMQNSRNTTCCLSRPFR
jgi:amidase